MRILIVGGGIAGLAMARAGRQAGLECEIVERAPNREIVGAGIYVPGNGMAALGRLGLAEAVAERGAVVGRRRIYDDRGRRLIDFDEAGLWKDVAPPIALHREELQRDPGGRRDRRADPVRRDRHVDRRWPGRRSSRLR